jgi:ligand-binding SRPBCC domain-containing protein
LPNPQKTLFVPPVKEKSAMNICHFKKSVQLAAPPEVVFDFHQNPENLRRISPPSLRVRKIISAPEAKPGQTFELEATQHGMPIHWIGRWEIVEPPLRLVDVAVRAPFPLFRHEHRFEANAAGGTMMTDIVTYALPFGVLGWLAGITGGRIALELMFRARHAATQKYFAQGENLG